MRKWDILEKGKGKRKGEAEKKKTGKKKGSERELLHSIHGYGNHLMDGKWLCEGDINVRLSLIRLKKKRTPKEWRSLDSWSEDDWDYYVMV